MSCDQGIGDSEGKIHDFAGPYFVGYDDMAFGRPTRYLQLNPKRLIDAEAWDASLKHADAVYCKRMHNLWCVPAFAAAMSICITLSVAKSGASCSAVASVRYSVSRVRRPSPSLPLSSSPSCDNCHSHVACALNHLRYNSSEGWNMVKLAAWVFFAGTHVSFGRAVSTWLPFLIICAVILGLALGL